MTRNNESTVYNIEDSNHIADVLSELEKELQDNSTNSHVDDIASYKVVFDQLAALGNDTAFKLSDNYKTISFTNIADFAGHFLEVTYNNLRKNFQLKGHSLPVKCNFTLKGRTLREALCQFQSELNTLEEFYGNLSDIDELCFVIAPTPVTTRDCYRIFKFSK